MKNWLKWLKRGVCFIFLIISVFLFPEEENLLPPIETLKGPSLHWEEVKTKEAIVEFKIDRDVKITNQSGSLYIRKENSEGYAEWRVENPMIKLEPGKEYTFSVWVKSKDVEKPPYFEGYSFNINKIPKRVADGYGKIGTADWYNIEKTFKIPEDSVEFRIGIGISGTGGEIWFCEPRLIKGKPEKKEEVEKMGNLPNWIWIKNDPGVPLVIFKKRLYIEKKPVKGIFQITADNIYEIFINNEKVGEDSDWQSIEKYEVSKFLKEGENEIKVYVYNIDGPAGLILKGKILCENGEVKDIISDENWEIEVPNYKEKFEIWKIGAPPISPWGRILIPEISFPKVLKILPLKVPSKVYCGEVLKMEFESSEGIPEEEINCIRISFLKDGDVVCISAYDKPIVSYDEKNLKIEVPISYYAIGGKYEWKIESASLMFIAENLKNEIEILKKDFLPKNTINLDNFRKNENKIEVSGKFQSPFFYNTVTPSVESYLKWHITEGHLYEIYYQIDGLWKNEEKMDIYPVMRHILQILEADEKANIILGIRIDMPFWWLKKNPEDVFISNKGRRGLQSFASDKWREDALKGINLLLKSLKSTPVGSHIVGITIMAFRGGEWQLWGEDVGEYDVSAVAKEKFLKWQKENGFSELIEIPHPALEYPFQSEEKNGYIRERFFRFLAERQAENIIYFAKAIKKEYGENFLVGVYYGYIFEHACSINRLLYGGHLGIYRVIKDPSIDFICCPASYGLRKPHQSHAFMFPCDSAVLNGKRPVLEDDVRNYLTPYPADSSGSKLPDLKTSVLSMRKIRLLAASHGAMVRCFALLDCIDFFQDTPILIEIKRLNDEIMNLKPAKLGEKNQVACVVDPLNYVKAYKIEPQVVRTFLSDIRDMLQRTGRSIVYITMDDYIERMNLWETVVIPLPGLLSEERIERIKKVWGDLPEIKNDTGALILSKKGNYICNDLEKLWGILKIKSDKNVVYVGENFVSIFEGEDICTTIK